MTAPTHIELFGLPGSGKTTLAERLCSEIFKGAYGLRTGYKTGVFRGLVPTQIQSHCIRVPIKLVDVIAHATGVQSGFPDGDPFIQLTNDILNCYTDDRDRENTVLEWIRDLLVRHSTASRLLEGEESIVCDEGYMQRANAVFCPPQPTANLEQVHIHEFVSAMPTPDLVVILDISVGTAAERIRKREDGPPESFSGLNDQRRRQLLERMDRFVESSVTTFDTLDVPYVRVPNDRSLAEAVRRIEEELGPYLS